MIPHRIAAISQLTSLGTVITFVTWGTSIGSLEDLERHPLICVLAFTFVMTYLADQTLRWWVEGEVETDD